MSVEDWLRKVKDFEGYRDLIRDLVKANRDAYDSVAKP